MVSRIGGIVTVGLIGGYGMDIWIVVDIVRFERCVGELSDPVS